MSETITETRPRQKASKKNIIENNTKKHKSTYTILAPKSKRQAALKEKLEAEEINNSNVKIKNEAIFCFDEYLNMRTLSKIPINNVWIDKFAVEMNNWFEKHDDVIRFDEFLRIKSMSWPDFTRLREKYEILNQSYYYCMSTIAQNREKQAARFKMNWATLATTQSHYCRISKEEAQNRAKLKEIQQQDTGTKFIIMEDVDKLATYIKNNNEKE